MPRYYFDTFDGTAMLADMVGDEFEGDKAAADQAVSLIPALAGDHIPDHHDITVATSLRNEAGAVIYRSIGLVRSQWSGDADHRFTVRIDEVAHHLVDGKRLREEMKELERKIRINMSSIFHQLEGLAALSEIRAK